MGRDEGNETATGESSTETVVPARQTVPLPTATPGQVALATLRRAYAENAKPIDLGEDIDEEELGSVDDWSETIRNLVSRTSRLVVLESYFETINEHCLISVGIIGQFESALNQLARTVENAYVQLAVQAGRCVLAPHWQDPLLILVNDEFEHLGEASRVFRYVVTWIHHARSEILLGYSEPDSYVAPPAPLNRNLRGHFNSFTEATDWSSTDPVAGLASSLFKVNAPQLPFSSGVPLQDALSQARANPAQFESAYGMSAFLDSDLSMEVPQPSYSILPPPDVSFANNGGGGCHGGGGGYGGGNGNNGGGGNGGGGNGGGGNGRHGGGDGYPPPGGTPPPGGPGGGYPPMQQQPPAAHAPGGLVIDMKVKIDTLPAWDGNERTALKYFSQLNKWARAGKKGELVHQLPYVAPLRFSGAVNTWWSNLSAQMRAALQSSISAFIPGIRRAYLSEHWALDKRGEFSAMRFRQKYHENESPFDYMNRRIFLARVLYDLTPAKLVVEVLVNSPPQWAYVLGDHNVRDTDELMTRVRQLGPSLISAHIAGMEPSGEATAAKIDRIVEERLEVYLKKAGLQSVTRAPVSNTNNPFRSPPPAKPYHAHISDSTTLDDPSTSSFERAPETTPEIVGASDSVFNMAHVLLTNGSKQRPPPVNGYPFKLQSTVVSKVAPPSPCKVCGSAAHWDRECEHYPQYVLCKQQSNVMYASDRPAAEERIYDTVYAAIANEIAFSSCSSVAPVLLAVRQFFLEQKSENTHEPGNLGEITREDDLPELLQAEDSDDEPNEPSLNAELQHAIFMQAMAAAVNIANEAGAPPHDIPVVDDRLPSQDRPIRMPRKRNPPPGRSGAGVTVLSCKGKVGSLLEQLITLRLDSCANLTLVAKRFLERLKHPPKVKKGMKLQIAQLTSSAPNIEGYVTLPTFIRGEDGTYLEFELEAYMVPDMTVDLLVGEDWHVNYEASVLRNITHGHRVQIGDTRASGRRSTRARARRSKEFSGSSWETPPVSSERKVTDEREPLGDLKTSAQWREEIRGCKCEEDVVLERLG
ncbi:hypothetical protein AURDEDRAFT_126032 [Auricularia subglabra TFB-10046 SS5]|nr:hypothetical protein AURDEDRAFT_126032 [Auricularia subglabra TFB-10046 SS5]